MPTAIFTLEMSKSEVTQRLMCSEAKVESQRLRTGKLAVDDWPRLTAACDKLAKAPVYVDDTGSITMMELRSKARRLKSREPELGLIIVDYLQLMTSGSNPENRVQEVSQISRNLKVLARDLEVPILAMSQLSRAVEQRHDKRPILSDLRESGCLAGDTRVYLPDSGRHVPIRELQGAEGKRVLAVDTETWRLEPRPILRAFSTGRKPVLQLTTRLGRRIGATANHKFLAFDGWRRLDDLAAGMRIAVPRRLVGPAEATMSDQEVGLLAHLIGDGCTLPRHAIQYTSADRDLAVLVASLARDVFDDAVTPRIARERSWYQVFLASSTRLTHGKRNPVAEWLDGLGVFGLRSHQKRVPEALFTQPEDRIATFLRHLWATDGCIKGDAMPSPVIRFDSSSEALSRDVQALLLRLGINASLRTVPMPGNGRPSHRLDVRGRDDGMRFLSSIGGLGSQRASACVETAERFRRVKASSKRDGIPKEAWSDVVAPALAAAGMTMQGLRTRLGTSYPSLPDRAITRERALQIAQIVESDQLGRLARSDLYWDTVLSIEPAGETDVFDLTIDERHNFVADCIVCHNSIEQDADLVMFVYRDEYYNDESDSQGLAELILAKHRNGPTDSIKLSFLKRYAKFADLAA
jgi:replicative DNA helicase